MNQQSACNASTRTPRMHAGSRFGDVFVGLQLDHEMRWYFNDAETESRQPSTLAATFSGRSSGSVEVFESGTEARHAARIISDRLETIGLRDERVLEALFTDRAWPGTLVRRFGPVVGVVEGLVGVRAAYLHAHRQQLTTAQSTTAWLEELVAKCSKDLVAWRLDAFGAVERAVKAYERVRGKDPSVVPPEQL